MKIVAVSDTHMGHSDLRLPEGDILIHAGDATYMGTIPEINEFGNWMRNQPFKHKIFVAGNHDWLFDHNRAYAEKLLHGITYLQDEEVTVEGLRIYGMPWQPAFNQWAFNLERNSDKMKAVCRKIPSGLDILVTHGPPILILDDKKGCECLMVQVAIKKPKVHIFGHIHAGYGHEKLGPTDFYNVSCMNEDYDLVNPFTVINYERIP